MATTDVSPAAPIKDDSARLNDAPPWRLYLMMAVIVLYCEIAALQYSMVAAAVRQIAPTFPSTGAGISWMLIIFGIVGGVVTPILGKLSDLVGKRLVMLGTGVFFLIGSFICALTSNWPLFLVGRGLQAVSIAAPAVAYGLIRDLFPRKYVPIAVGMIATGFGLSALAAPLLGGWMLDSYSWRSIFWFLIIYTAVLTPALFFLVPETRIRANQSLDITGAVLLGAGVGSALLYLSQGQAWGWGRFTSYGYLILGIVLLVAFVLVERRAREPIMDMKLLFNPKLSLTLLCGGLLAIVIGTQGYVVAYLLQSPTKAQLGAQFIDGAIKQGLPADVASKATVVFNTPSSGFGLSLFDYATHAAIFSGGMSMLAGIGFAAATRKIGARIPAILACVLMGLACLLYGLFNAQWYEFALVGMVFGIGFGCYYASLPNMIVDAVPADQQGISSGMFGVINSIGVSIGAAITAAILSGNVLTAELHVPGMPLSQTAPHGPTVLSTQLYTLHGYAVSLWVSAGACVIALAVAIYMKHGRTPTTGGEISH
ncbi:MFS transporter [Streptomyces sp. NPDC096311]|uniref:MFS transporter n=1 Tax=Streptomyces sp. NPDC096311 TaxID=3366083 RepID=UPI00382FBCBA